MKYKTVFFLTLNTLFAQPKAHAMSMPLVEYYPLVDVDVDQIPRRVNPPRFTPRAAPNNPFIPTKGLDLPLDETTYFEKNIKRAYLSLGVITTIIILIKLYVWHKNAQVQKKLDDLNRIVTTGSWDEEDPKLIKELYTFLCELRDHPDCREQKDELIRVINYFPEPMRKQFEKKTDSTLIATTDQKKEWPNDPDNFVTKIIPYYFLWINLF